MHYIRLFFLTLILIFFLSSCKNSGHLASQNSEKESNALINESSPYLLQHAYNPVNWHPWSEATLAKAKKENKLLIISIGYSACHWCHVMEHESFEDLEVAQLMNDHFIPVKVDREERPDVDDIYMTACNLVSGRGGWPLNAFAMPDGRPIWAGTYFPKDNWIEILNNFINLKTNDTAKLEDSAERLTAGVNSVGLIDIATVPKQFSGEELNTSVSRFLSNIDKVNGGRMGAPKFPMPNNYEMLLKFSHLFKDKTALETIIVTLDKMAHGGIYDHVGGGFARYSVDDVWKVPHFEKMLYDNSQLIGLYSKAYRLIKKPLYKKVVEQSLDFIEREMTSNEGGFYSSLDADSEGEEGKYYVWTEKEIAKILKVPELIEIAKLYYSTAPNGNWENSNILHVTKSLKEISQQLNISLEELEKRVEKINSVLLKERQNRIRPGLDDKILTGWNALMISGYTEAYKAFGKEEILEKAIRSAEFILKNQMNSDNRLNRNYKKGISSINGFLGDYSALIKAMLDLYEVTFDTKWVDMAKALMEYSLLHFSNEENSMFFRASDIDSPLVSKSIETSDNVIPANNSMMARNLLRLGQMTYNPDYIKRSKQMLSNMYDVLKNTDQPGFYSNWLQLWLDHVKPPYEIVITGSEARFYRQELFQNYLGNALVLGTDENITPLPLLENKFVPNKTFIYVCENKVCQLPVEKIKDALSILEKGL